MRGYEKEIIQSQLKDEKYVIKQLKNLYSSSLQQIDGKIQELLAKYDATQLQSVIYQLDYQKALKTQINGILDTLQADEYETISDYLTKCYENGFMGSMYSMNKQGVPLILPFDQEQVINAIVHQSKISKGLYEALGFNMKDLKKRISAEVSRGIANGMGYSEIARNLRNTSGIGINNATRIARTEGHRIQAQSQLDACNKAKKKGADVVKQWDATLDGRTRPHHRKLDGQIRELDDYFEVNGKKAKAPSQFGKPEEDINCRCVLLQRARWGLDEDELKTLEERAEFYGLDKTEDFEEFKEKYLKAVKEEEVIQKTQASIVKANSISELNEITLNELKEFGVKQVNLEGMDLELAKTQMEQWTKLTREYNIECVDIKVRRLNRAQAQVTKIGSGNQCVLEYNLNTYKKSDLQSNHYKVSTGMNFLTNVDEKNIPIATTTHEFAHGIIMPRQLKQYGINLDIVKEIESVKRKYELALTRIEKKYIVEKSIDYATREAMRKEIFISEYAKTSLDEWVAEAFCQAKLSSNPSPYALELLKVIDKYFKR